jgi:transcriptional regulator with XRE-family HTH domain
MREFAELAVISNPYLSHLKSVSVADRAWLRAPSEQILQSIADALQVSAGTHCDQAGLPRSASGRPAARLTGTIEPDRGSHHEQHGAPAPVLS